MDDGEPALNMRKVLKSDGDPPSIIPSFGEPMRIDIHLTPSNCHKLTPSTNTSPDEGVFGKSIADILSTFLVVNLQYAIYANRV